MRSTTIPTSFALLLCGLASGLAACGGADGLGRTEGSNCVNVNAADTKLLTTLPGVGEALAKKIVAGRPYAHVDELLAVSGIGPKTLAELGDFVILDGESRRKTPGERCIKFVPPASR